MKAKARAIDPIADEPDKKSGSAAMSAGEDRRVRRTRAAVVQAFNHLVLSRRRGKIRVADIVEQANVGRSTFYDHYSNAEEVHLEALSAPFAILADAAAGRGDAARLEPLLTHFWENRQRARETFDQGRMQEKTARLLTDMVEARLRQDDVELVISTRLAALQLAEGALAPIRGWMTGASPSTAQALATAICSSSAHILIALSLRPTA